MPDYMNRPTEQDWREADDLRWERDRAAIQEDRFREATDAEVGTQTADDSHEYGVALAERVVQTLADTKPTKCAAIGQEVLGGTLAESCFVVEISELERVVASVVQSALFDREITLTPEPKHDTPLVLTWRDGPPPHPWDSEWFIAETIYRDRVVLRALPREHTYDFETADETHMLARYVRRWMQFPDSAFVTPETQTADPVESEAGG